jgi:HEAT repeat protein
MKSDKIDVAQVLSLSSGGTVKSSDIADLTELDPEELGVFRKIWPGLGDAQREQVMARLVEIAEENVELNFDDIFRFCLSDANAEVRKLAIEGLWENERPGLMDRLIHMLEGDSSEKVRAAAATALGRFTLLGEHGRLPPGSLDRIKAALLAVFEDRGIVDEVRRRALESIAPVTAPDVKKAIASAYARGNDRLKVGALYAMGRSCDPQWAPILLKELGNPEAEFRFEAVRALGELAEQEAVPKLLELGNDPDAEVQRAAIEALGKIGGPRAKDYLHSCMSSRSEPVREAARHALNELQASEDPLSMPM